MQIKIDMLSISGRIDGELQSDVECTKGLCIIGSVGIIGIIISEIGISMARNTATIWEHARIDGLLAIPQLRVPSLLIHADNLPVWITIASDMVLCGAAVTILHTEEFLPVLHPTDGEDTSCTWLIQCYVHWPVGQRVNISRVVALAVLSTKLARVA